MTRTYLELVLELPWTKATQDELDLKHTRKSSTRTTSVSNR